jgi:uncharacterized protein
MKKTRAALLAATGTLALPAIAAAHVTVHPNVIPEGAYAVLDVRVPNETDDANTTKVSVQLPPGIASLSTTPVAGWKATLTKTKLATPIKTDDGEIDEQVSRVDFTGTLPPGQFVEFPLSIGVPGKDGDTLTFKALQSYDDGEVVRWIGPPGDEHPAPTIHISAPGGVIEDSAGDGAPAAATIIRKESGGKGLAIAALILGALGLAVGGVSLTTRGRRS